MLRLFRKKKPDPRQQLLDVLGEYEPPTFPAVITAGLQKVRDDDASSASIADLLSTDPGLTVRLLGTVNSAAFALRHEVKSIHHAVSLLGRSQLESLLISMAVRDSLPREAGPAFDSRRFWTTSAQRATTGRALAELIDPPTRSESFTAALLQDLAVPILSQRKGEAYGELLGHWHNSDEDLAQLEQSAYGWNHAGIGRCLCEQWEFPELLALAIGTHHDQGELQGETPLPAARLVSRLREVNGDRGVEMLVEAVHDQYGIPKDQTMGIVRESFESADDIARMFN